MFEYFFSALRRAVEEDKTIEMIKIWKRFDRLRILIKLEGEILLDARFDKEKFDLGKIESDFDDFWDLLWQIGYQRALKLLKEKLEFTDEDLEYFKEDLFQEVDGNLSLIHRATVYFTSDEDVIDTPNRRKTVLKLFKPEFVDYYPPP
jgi:hypothetical protein